MKGKIAILHLSDLHIVEPLFYNKEIEKSKFQTEETYIDKLLSDIKKQSAGYHLKCLIISGDVANASEEKEYEYATTILSKISHELQISKENIIMVPGNHDINRFLLEQYVRTNGLVDKSKYHECHEIKLKNFKHFYDDFFHNQKTLDINKAIFDIVELNEINTVIFGINTVYKESYLDIDHIGYINIPNLRNELETLGEKYSNMFKIAVFHHNSNSIGNIKNLITNWEDVKVILRIHNIHTIFAGHTHLSNAVNERMLDQVSYVVAGSIGTNNKSIANSYNIFLESENDDHQKVLKIINSKYEKDYDGEGYWQKQDCNPNMLQEILIDTKDVTSAISKTIKDIAKEKVINIPTPFASVDADVFLTDGVLDEQSLSDFIIQVIKDNRLYSSGHYHWDKNIRTHASIDTDRLLGNYIYMDRIKNFIYHNIIKENCMNTDLLIGYSMQGNVLGSVIAAEMSCLYTYYPNIARMHGDYEKILPEIDKSINITIIFDVIYSGSSLKNLVGILKEKYSEISSINVCSVLFTNASDYNTDLFSNREHKEFFIDERIRFYSTCNLKIAGCPYTDIADCLVYSNNLETVNIFHSEGNENESN